MGEVVRDPVTTSWGGKHQFLFVHLRFKRFGLSESFLREVRDASKLDDDILEKMTMDLDSMFKATTASASSLEPASPTAEVSQASPDTPTALVLEPLQIKVAESGAELEVAEQSSLLT